MEGAVFGPVHPRDDRAIAKTNHTFGTKPYLAGTSKNDTHQIKLAISSGHEIDHGRGAGLGLEFGFENQRIGKVATAHIWRGRYGCNQPPAVLGRSEQSRKARRRVEARPAQPIDGAVATDQGCAVAVPNHRVIFDPQRHCTSTSRFSAPAHPKLPPFARYTVSDLPVIDM